MLLVMRPKWPKSSLGFDTQRAVALPQQPGDSQLAQAMSCLNPRRLVLACAFTESVPTLVLKPSTHDR